MNNASVLANELKKLGLRLVSGGTDTHLVLVDLASIGVTGKDAEEVLQSVGIVLNRNSVPFVDNVSPRITTGIQVGTPAVTDPGIRH